MVDEYDPRYSGLRLIDWYSGIDGLELRLCMPGRVSVIEKIGQPEKRLLALCLQARQTGHLEGVEPETTATLLATGVLRKEGDRLSITVPWLNRQQLAAFTSLARPMVDAIAGDLRAFLREANACIQRSLPKHLSGQAELYGMRAVHSLLGDVLGRIWPEDSFAAAGLLLVEDSHHPA